MDLLQRITETAQAQLAQEAEVERLTQELKNAADELAKIRTEDLPLLMQEAGLEEIKLPNGKKVTLTEEVYGSIIKEQQEAACDWLEANDFGGIIKTQVVTPFQKGEYEEAKRLADSLHNEFPLTHALRSVHHSTFTAFTREQLEKGTTLPPELFNYGACSVTKIK